MTLSPHIVATSDMASFGFSVGDIVLVSNLAHDVYKSCRNAGKDFRAIRYDGEGVCTQINARSIADM
jgi:hypothetical protein